MKRIIYEDSNKGAHIYRRDISSERHSPPASEKHRRGNYGSQPAHKVLELRNYVAEPGQRDKFISYFETNFIDSQNAIGGYILGQFRVKDADDNFFWIRGFNDMAARGRYLPEFYRGEFWKQRRNYLNDMLINNDNVYLLKP